MRRTQAGIAMFLVLSIVALMLLVAGVGMAVFMGGLKMTGQDLSAKRALFCAESGLAVGKGYFGDRYALWDRFLACNLSRNCAPIGYPLRGYAEPAEGRFQYTVEIFDNLDEPAAMSDPAHDNDLTIIVQSRCTEPGLPPQLLQEVVTLKTSAASGGYRQAGGFAGTNNSNLGGP